MKQELVKQVVKVGNSAGVILPREWLDGKARVELIERPLNVKREVLEILEEYLEHIIGIYLVGSYARGEEEDRSDVDVIVITDRINKRINSGKYNVILISYGAVRRALDKNAIPILPMLKEAKTLLNADLLEKYKKNKLTKKNVRLHVGLAESSLKISDSFIELSREHGWKVGDAVAYSLILNLRTLQTIDCLRRGKICKKKELVSLARKLSGSNAAYEGYLRVKDSMNSLDELSVEEADGIYSYLIGKIGEYKKWLKEKRD